jgi:hypothetical protein
MKNFLSPWWVIGVVIIPHLLLVGLFWSSYYVIASHLTPLNLIYWTNYGLSLGLITVGSAIYATFCFVKKRVLHAGFGIVTLISHSAILGAFLQDSSQIIPSGIPPWVFIDGDLGLYVYTLLMPAALYGLILSVVVFTPKVYETNTFLNFLWAIMIPIFCYILVAGTPFLRMNFSESIFMRHLSVIFLVLLVLAFLFYSVRFFYVLILKQYALVKREPLFWKILFLFIAPLLGLYFNDRFEHIFGDFGKFDIYLIALCNGLLLCLPTFGNQRLRLILFALRSVGFAYIVYFTLVFMPFLPLVLPAVLIYGLGILMLMPLVNFIMQGYTLSQDYVYLRQAWNIGLLRTVFVVGFATLPALLLWECAKDRENLHKALAYLYETDFQTKAPTIDDDAIAQVLQNVSNTKDRRGGNLMMNNKGQMPYISAFYRWYVLGRLTLSDEKINELSQVFLGKEFIQNTPSNRTAPNNTQVVLDSLWTETTYHSETQTYSTWLHTKTRNLSELPMQEFRTEFHLPQGVWISDYYLDLPNGTREKGILAERKAATWIYQQITAVRRDPGILEYNSNGKVTWRIFPYLAGEVRTSGIQFLHKEPLKKPKSPPLQRAGDSTQRSGIKNIALEIDSSAVKEILLEKGAIRYIPASMKANLPIVTRPLQYFFVLNNGKESTNKTAFYIQQVKQTVAENHINPQHVQIVLTDYQTESFGMQGGWEVRLQARKTKGGFYWERAVKQILSKNYVDNSFQPVIIVLGEQNLNSTVLRKVENMGVAFSETEAIYWLLPKETSYTILPVGRQEQGNLRKTSTFSANAVRAYPDTKKPLAYLPDNGKPSVILQGKLSLEKLANMTQKKSWEAGLYLWASERVYEMYPNEGQARWFANIQTSFRTQIQIQGTSFIALEDELQKQTLLAKQKQTLTAKHYLDTHEEELRRMSEPVWIWVVVIVALVGIGVRRLFVL